MLSAACVSIENPVRPAGELGLVRGTGIWAGVLGRQKGCAGAKENCKGVCL